MLDHAFHGRTLMALAMTPKPAYQEGYGPLVPGFRVVAPDRVAEEVRPETLAVFLEPIQGEGGCLPVPNLHGIRAACDAYGALLAYDEIQCGLGRSGLLRVEPRPDVVTLAKALGGGLPLGAMMALRPELQEVFQPGDHGSTFGGNPIACAAGKAVLEVILEQRLWENCAAMGARLQAGLEAVGVAVTGAGLLMAAHLGRPNGPVLDGMRERGLLAVASGAEGVRFLPPFTITAGEIDQIVEIFAASL